MRALERRFGKQDAVVRDHADQVAKQAGETAYQRSAVERLELVELAAVQDTSQHLAHVIRFARIRRDQTVDFLRIIGRVSRGAKIGPERFWGVWDFGGRA